MTHTTVPTTSCRCGHHTPCTKEVFSQLCDLLLSDSSLWDCDIGNALELMVSSTSDEIPQLKTSKLKQEQLNRIMDAMYTLIHSFYELIRETAELGGEPTQHNANIIHFRMKTLVDQCTKVSTATAPAPHATGR